MRIEDGGAQAAKAGAARQAQNTDEASGTDAKTSAKAPRRGDRVEISDVGRTLADGLTVGDVGDAGEGSLSVDEIQTLRERVTDGFYESSQVDEAIAKGILESGEL